MFSASPRYARLSQQVAATLEEGILRGKWKASLPSERQLAETLLVSRRTVRAAIELLRQKELVGTSQGAGTKILRARSGERKREGFRHFGLLLPEPIEHLRPQTMAFIDALRALLYAHGYRLDTHIGQRFFSARPAAALRKLVEQYPHDGWILALSTRANQLWFQEQKIPTMVAGTPHCGVDLPYLDIDMRATGRHAAGELIRRGHRRLALLIEKSDKAGDRETEEGFLEALRGGATSAVHRHAGTAASIKLLIRRIMRDPARPTALFVANPYHYLAVASTLAEMGVRVPRDVSLLCRDDDPFLSYLVTEPARYECSPESRAKTAFGILMKMAGKAAKARALRVKVIPGFSPGFTISDFSGE